MKPSNMAGQVAGKAKSMGKALKGYGGIFRQLAEEHGEVAALIQSVRASDGSSSTRRELFPEIHRRLLSHARAEQQEFYGPLRTRTELMSTVQHGVEEHRRIESLLNELRDGDISSDTWARTFAKLADAVTEHVDEEENEIFPKAKAALSQDDADRMKSKYVRARKAEEARIV